MQPRHLWPSKDIAMAVDDEISRPHLNSVASAIRPRPCLQLFWLWRVVFETAQFFLSLFAAPSKLGAVFVLLERDVAAPSNFYTGVCSDVQEPLTCTEVLKSMAGWLKNCLNLPTR